MIDPQRFNLYAYARNNPFVFIDPTGEDIEFVNDTEEGREDALGLIVQNLSTDEAANIGMRKKKNGKGYEAYIKNKKAVGENASTSYKRLAGLINDHSIVADVGLIGGGLTATFTDFGKVSSWSNRDSVIEPAPGNNHVSVIVTQGDYPGGVEVTDGEHIFNDTEPDYISMWHELVGETRKYRTGFEYLRGPKNAIRDSRTVIKIENEARAFQGMNPRTGADHGSTTITVDGKTE
jgi:hypothetical protein